MEDEALQGAVIRVARRHGITAPWMDAAYEIVQPLARRETRRPEERAPTPA